MHSVSNNVIALNQRKPRAALEHLNRVTGLNFSRWPESLLACCLTENTQLEPVVPVALREA